MLQQEFPQYFTDLYLKLPYPLIVYWNDEDDCYMGEVGVNNTVFLRTHSDTFEGVTKEVRDLIVSDLETSVIHEDVFPMAFYNSGKLFKHLEEIYYGMGYDKLIDFIEYEKHLIRSAFYDHFHEHQNGLIHPFGTYDKEEKE